MKPTLLVLGLLTIFMGCGRSHTASIRSTAKSRFSGKILDSETGKPIADMCVRLRGSRHCLAKTDSAGQYSFEVAGADPFLITFVAQPGDRSPFMSFYHRDSKIISTFYYTHTKPYPIMDPNSINPGPVALPGIGGGRPTQRGYSPYRY